MPSMMAVWQDANLAPELVVDLGRPFLTAAATRVAVHGNISGGRCNARKDRHQEDSQTNHSVFHVSSCHRVSLCLMR
jgi:hypothetical protein